MATQPNAQTRPVKTATLETITPDIARKYLDASKGNRTIYDVRVDNWAEAIRAGEWQITDQGIGFDYLGVLRNGHHRLLAVIKTGMPIETFVMRGLDPEFVLAVDQNGNRTLGDTLTMFDNVQNGKPKETLLRRVYAEENNLTRANRVPQFVLRKLYLDNHEAIDRAYEMGVLAQKRMKKRANAAVIGAVYYFAAKQDENAAREFFDKLTTGADLREDDPIFHARNELLYAQRKGGWQHKLFGKLNGAWIKWRAGQPVSRLRANWRLPPF